MDLVAEIVYMHFEIREDEKKNMEVKDFIEGVLITGGSWICAVVLIGLP